MNLRSLQYFLVVLEELNISRAAERLFVSPQALSEHIKKLESFYDVKLFERGHGLIPTYVGRRLAEWAEKICNIDKDINKFMDDVHKNRKGEIRFGISYTRARLFLSRILPRFKMEHPGVDFYLFTGKPDTMFSQLQKGDIDFYMGFKDREENVPPGLSSFCLIDERIFLTITLRLLRLIFGDGTLKRVSSLSEGTSIEPFADQNFLILKKGHMTRKILDEVCAEKSVALKILFEGDDAEMLNILSAQSMGVSFIPELLLLCRREYFLPRGEDTLFAFPLINAVGENLIMQFRLFSHSGRYLSSIERSFVRTLEDEIKAAGLRSEPINRQINHQTSHQL